MKTISLPTENLTVERLLNEASGNEVVFLETNGRIRFAVMPADESDQEVAALRANPTFMAYLDKVEERARTKPRKSLAQIRSEYLPVGDANEESGG